MDKELLKKNYSNACNNYLEAFCEKHEFNGLDSPLTYWIGDEPGGIANCGDLIFDMATIITDIDEDAPEEELLKWYDYTVEASEFNLPTPNFHSWLHGCPRSTKETLDNLRRMKANLESLCQEERDKNNKI